MTLTAEVEREALERQLDSACAELGDDEIRTLVVLARRLLEGQRAYGRIDLTNDTRDFRRERSEEIQDLLVYSAFETLRAERAGTP